MKMWNKEESNKSALSVTLEELKSMGISVEEVSRGEVRGKMKTFGPWGIPLSYTALAMSRKYTRKEDQRFTAECDGVSAFGIRTLSRPVQSGYELEGRISVNGKKYRGFTSSQLFELPCGHLVNVAIIHVCI
jgi:hypothetical protein